MNRRFILASLTLALLAVAGLGSELRAQCNAILIKNRTACDITFCFSNVPSNPSCFTVPAGADTSIAIRPGGPLPGVANICGQVINFPPNSGCISSIMVAPNCCAQVCWNPMTCTIEATPVAGPCDC